MAEITPVALIPAATAIVGAILGFIFNMLLEKRKHHQAASMKVQDMEYERFKELRKAAVELAISASHVTRNRPGHGAKENFPDGLPHEEVRTAYLAVLLLTTSTQVQRTARSLVRVSWNVQEELAGRPRKRPQKTPGLPPIKEVREAVLPFFEAVRQEMGVTGELVDEPTD